MFWNFYLFLWLWTYTSLLLEDWLLFSGSRLRLSRFQSKLQTCPFYFFQLLDLHLRLKEKQATWWKQGTVAGLKGRSDKTTTFHIICLPSPWETNYVIKVILWQVPNLVTTLREEVCLCFACSGRTGSLHSERRKGEWR